MKLDTLQFVLRTDKPTAVQIDIETWYKIVEVLEDAEDVSLARKALAKLETAGRNPDEAGRLRLEGVGSHYRARAMLSNSEASVEDTFGRPVPSS